MSKNIKIFLSIVIFIIILISIYFILGEKHPYVVYIFSLAVILKIKAFSLISFFLNEIYLFLIASKSTIFAFIKNLTIYKGISLTVKRFLIDNVLSKWLDNHLISHLKEPIKDFFDYYKNLNWKLKIKKSILFILPVGFITFGLYFAGLIESIALYAELKAFVIAFFKILWIFLSKVIASILYFFTNFIAGTWLAPVLEIFAISWLLSMIERIPYLGPPIKRFFDLLSKGLKFIFKRIVFYFNYYFGNFTAKHIGKYGKNFGIFLSKKVHNIKRKNEIFLFESFKKNFINKDVQKYFSGIDVYQDKKSFYKNVNSKTKDHFDIKAFFDLGLELNDGIFDVLIIESFASNDISGNSLLYSKIHKSSFWILNLSQKKLSFISSNNYFEKIDLNPNDLVLVNPNIEIYDINDLYIENILKNHIILLQK